MLAGIYPAFIFIKCTPDLQPGIFSVDDLVGFAEKQLADHFTSMAIRLPDGNIAESGDAVLQCIFILIKGKSSDL
jgi:hypothetical protein